MLCLAFLFFVGVQLLYNVVLLSTVQQHKSTVCIYISPRFWTSFSLPPYPTPNELPVLYSSFHQLSVLHMECSCLENHMERGTWWATVHRVAKSQTQLKQLSRHKHVYICQCHCLSLSPFSQLPSTRPFSTSASLFLP